MPRNAVVSLAALVVLLAAAELLWAGVSGYVIVVRPNCGADCDSGIDAGDWVGLALLLAGGVVALRLALPVAQRPETPGSAGRLAVAGAAAVIGVSGLGFF
jgi:hypothetical protein